MTAALVLILVSIMDLPSLISAIGALRVTSWWKLPFVIFFAVLFNEIFGAIFDPFYEPFRLLAFTIIAQSIVTIFVFYNAQAIRRRYADDPSRAKKKLTQFTRIIFVVIGLIFIGLICWGAQQAVVQIKASKKQASLHRSTVSHFDNGLAEQDAPSKQLPATNVPKLGDRRDGGSIYLYREPVEIWWNDWTGKNLSHGKAYISGEGKTATFEGIIQLNCQSGSGYTWLTASNGFRSRSMTEADLNRTVPIEVISAAFAVFCPKLF